MVLSKELQEQLGLRAKDLQAQLEKLNKTKEQLEKKMKEKAKPVNNSGKLNPDDVKDAAKNAVKAILESKNPPDPPPVITTNKSGKLIYQYKARCNEGVNMVYEELTGNTDLAGKRANKMIDHFANPNNKWKEISLEDAHKLANEGYIVVAGWHSHSETESGHVAVVVPGEMVESGNWKRDVPMSMDTGGSARQSAGPLTNGFGKDKQPPRTKFYVYKGPINK